MSSTPTTGFAMPLTVTPPVVPGSTVVVETPKAKPPAMWKTHGAAVAGTVVAAGAVAAAAVWLPNDLTLAGAAILSAAVAGVAAARVFTTRMPGVAALTAFAGVIAVAAVTTLGATHAVNSAKSESVVVQQLLGQERAALSAERAALAAERRVLTDERGTVKTARDEVVAQRQGFENDKSAFQLRVNEAAAALAAPERQALASARTALDAERHQTAEKRFAAIAAEARKLTPRQLQALDETIDKYSEAQKNGTVMRLVGEPFAEGASTSATMQRTLDNGRVIATLVTTGAIYGGPSIVASDNFYVVPQSAAYRITSVAQLLEYLRLHTGKDIATNP